jgi:hypothetical protein
MAKIMGNILVLSLVLIGNVLSAQQSYYQYTIKEGVGTPKVFIGKSRASVRRELGCPEDCYHRPKKIVRHEYGSPPSGSNSKPTTWWEKRHKRDVYCYDSLGIRLEFKKGKVSWICFSSPKFVTESGIRVGDTLANLKEAYGEIKYINNNIIFLLDDFETVGNGNGRKIVEIEIPSIHNASRAHPVPFSSCRDGCKD